MIVNQDPITGPEEEEVMTVGKEAEEIVGMVMIVEVDTAKTEEAAEAIAERVAEEINVRDVELVTLLPRTIGLFWERDSPTM